MKTQNLNAVQERIRQVKLELARLRMVERLAKMKEDSRGKRGKGGGD